MRRRREPRASRATPYAKETDSGIFGMVKDYVSKPLSWLWGGSTNEPALPALLPPPVQERVALTFPTDQVIDHPATPAHCITAPGLQIDARPAECFEQQS